MDDIIIPEDHLENSLDRLGFNIFVKALFHILRLEEGIIIDHENKKYLLHKFKNEEMNEILIGFQDVTDDKYCGFYSHGTLLWLDLQKPENERHLDDEPLDSEK